MLDIAERAAAYRARGYAALPGFLAPELGAGLVAQFMRDLAAGAIAPWRSGTDVPLLNASAIEIHSRGYPAMRSFHWGMTPAAVRLAECRLLPTYCYLRIYRRGAVCRVHGDRPACEHSISLMLAHSDAIPWPLDVATGVTPRGVRGVADDFEGDAHESLPMAAGDAVLYQGIVHRHGRLTPNPNGWSAHLFLHWVDADGRHAGEAFDGDAPAPLEL